VKDFDSIFEDYRPLPEEVTPSTESISFEIPMNYALKNRERFRFAFEHSLPCIPEKLCTLVDIGTWPGSLLRLFHRLRPSKDYHLVGVGLMASQEFISAMKEDCGAEIMEAMLDPKNQPLMEKGFPTRIPLDDNSAEVSFAMEVIPHLVSPAHFFSEAYRICAPGGHFILTTTNASKIGSIFKLLAGRSTLDGVSLPENDYRNIDYPAVFRQYSMSEVHRLFSRVGFEIVESRYFDVDVTQYNVKSFSQRLIDWAKFPFSAVPHLRGHLLVIGRKPE
jgi:SAM-dependent methyltransferase